eukprot:scaffold909_cov575-Prasinococcus_capsulatus_cf.AAC.9
MLVTSSNGLAKLRIPEEPTREQLQSALAHSGRGGQLDHLFVVFREETTAGQEQGLAGLDGTCTQTRWSLAVAHTSISIDREEVFQPRSAQAHPGLQVPHTPHKRSVGSSFVLEYAKAWIGPLVAPIPLRDTLTFVGLPDSLPRRFSDTYVRGQHCIKQKDSGTHGQRIRAQAGTFHGGMAANSQAICELLPSPGRYVA